MQGEEENRSFWEEVKYHKHWIFDRMPATLNQTLRWHWMKRHKYNEGWFYHLLSEAGKCPFEPTGVTKLRIEVYRSRFQDKDNMYGSVKPLVDAVKKLGWLEDDDPGHVDLKVEEIKSKRVNQRTEIFLDGETEED